MGKYNIKEAKDNRIIILGDTILDMYMHVQKKQQNSKILVPQKKYYYLGGAANVYHNINTLGGNAVYLTSYGDSARTKRIDNLLRGKSSNDYYIIKEDSRDICHKTNLYLNDQLLYRIDEDFDQSTELNTADKLYNQLKYLIYNTKIVVISDYHKGCITESLYLRVKELCQQENVKFIVECKKKYNFSQVDVLKMNKAEFESILGIKHKGVEELCKNTKAFKEENNIRNLIITLNQGGLIFIDQNNQIYHEDAYCKKAVDTSGAGDTLLAGIAVGLVKDMNFNDIIHFASCAAAVSCSKIATYAVNLKEVQRVMENVC